VPRVIFQVGEEERRLYVQAAHRELVTLSEWLRRAAEVRLNGGLAAAEAGPEPGRAVPPAPRSPEAASLSDSRASVAASPDEETVARRNPVKTHGPDWKKGGK